jgi:hypothetical protein
MNTRLVIILFVFGAALASCHNRNEQIPADVVNIPNTAEGELSAEKLPALTFNKTAHDFGRVIQGEIVSYAFRFTNTGGSDLLIANVSASCGCTATKYPKRSIKPGEEEGIEVTFESAGRSGFQHKTVTIAANTQPNTTVISIKANVIMPEKIDLTK